MTGKFGTQTVVLSYCEYPSYSNLVFVDEAAFREYFDKPCILELWDEDATIDDIMDVNLLGFDIVEVIGT